MADSNPQMSEESSATGEGSSVASAQPASETRLTGRDHAAFLNSYVPDDDGLYDDCPSEVCT